jgi:arsenate reductase
VSDAVIIFHNPACGTSRNTLALIEAEGVSPTIIEYMTAGWTKSQLQGLFTHAGMTPRQALRAKEALASELGLNDPATSDDAILDAMVAHPILVERPIVATPLGVALCRPAERVLPLLGR